MRKVIRCAVFLASASLQQSAVGTQQASSLLPCFLCRMPLPMLYRQQGAALQFLLSRKVLKASAGLAENCIPVCRHNQQICLAEQAQEV